MFVGVTGKIEHAVVSTVSNFIPESIRQKWRGYWQSVKKTETDTLGNGDVSETVEMMGWGVEKAQEHHNETASKYLGCHFRRQEYQVTSGLVSPTGRLNDGLHCAAANTFLFLLGLGTQLALAYAIHKSFIFLRVPLTAALTPKIVKKLRSWGWNIGKKA